MTTTAGRGLRRAAALAWLAVAAVAGLGCRDRERAVAEDAAPTPAQTAEAADGRQPTGSPPSADPRIPACRRAFREEEPLLLPHSFAEFTLCDVLVAIFPDFDTSVERSAAAGGTVRVDRVRQWVTSARTLLVVAHYIGEDADAEFVCGGCRVNPRLAVLERSGTALTLVARGTVPGWDPDGLLYGRTEFDSRSYSFQGDETLLGMRTPWSYGMMGGTTRLSLFRLEGTQLSLVFDDRLEWVASGMGLEDDDVVSVAVSQQRRASGPDDIVLTVHQARCRWEDYKRVCGPKKLAAQQRWRFDSKQYRQISGKPMPMPQLFRTRWGW